MNKMIMGVAAVLLGVNLGVCAEKPASSSFTCFSKYYTLNASRIDISGTVISNTEIGNLTVLSPDNALDSRYKNLTADLSYKPTSYKGFNRYAIANNHGDSSITGSLYILLPADIEGIRGAFVGYVSDANADSSGSSGYFEVLCKK